MEIIISKRAWYLPFSLHQEGGSRKLLYYGKE